MDYFEKYLKMNTLSSKMTGYFSAKALYDSSLPLNVRKEILSYLIKVWSEVENDSDVVQGWIKEWEKDIQSLSA